jgi:hypothetical protein
MTYGWSEPFEDEPRETKEEENARVAYEVDAQREAAAEWPNFHPDDPGGFDDWEPGECEFCSADPVLVRSVSVQSGACSDSLRRCISCERKADFR